MKAFNRINFKNHLLMKIYSFKMFGCSLMLLATALFMASCSSGAKEKAGEPDEVVIDISQLDSDFLNDIGEVKKIFYSLPSPLETAMMIRSAGAMYNEDLLNPLDNAANYTTTKSLALNLGAYTCDLSFASLYDQTGASIDYMNAAKKMADGLGILDAINEETIERLEENINNRDIIMEIISDTFMNSSSYLQENNRANVAAIVLVGGWMEGLFLATQMVELDSLESSKLVDRIMDQKMSLEIVVKLLEESEDSPDVQSVMEDIMELKAIFNKVTITTTPIVTSVDEETNITTLKSKTQTSLTLEVFLELRDKVAIIRNKYIS